MKELHVFRCGAEDLYAVTEDRSGANLPKDMCSSRWMLMKSMSFEGHMPPFGMDVAAQEMQGAVLAGLSMNGYFVSEGGALPPELIAPGKT
ncbi:MAG: hypothetical protein K2Y29_14185 [Beijerinckiaceae bacterium]|nr:hypothetical protein [Beijerinckiaceae bacterium]